MKKKKINAELSNKHAMRLKKNPRFSRLTTKGRAATAPGPAACRHGAQPGRAALGGGGKSLGDGF